jgi:hypothetical protein
MKAAVWRKWIRRVPEIGGLRGMAGVTAGWQKTPIKTFYSLLFSGKQGISSTHIQVAEEEWCHQHHYSPEIVRNLINLA